MRLGTASKGGGKSGGFRVVTYYTDPLALDGTIYLVTIYDKSEQSSISKKDLLRIVKK